MLAQTTGAVAAAAAAAGGGGEAMQVDGAGGGGAAEEEEEEEDGMGTIHMRGPLPPAEGTWASCVRLLDPKVRHACMMHA